MTDLESVLKSFAITDLYLVGLALDFCVKHTALDAVELGYRTFVIEDATRSVAEEVEGCRRELMDGGVVILRSDSEDLP